MNKPLKERAARMLESLERDPARPEVDAALVDEELRAAGGDPAAIRSEGAALAEKLLEHRRRAIAERTRRDLDRRRAAASRAPRVSRGSRDELLAMLVAVQNDPRYAGQVSAMFRKRSLAEATTEELAVLLEEIEAARLADEAGEDDQDPR